MFTDAITLERDKFPEQTSSLIQYVRTQQVRISLSWYLQVVGCQLLRYRCSAPTAARSQ